LHVEFENVHVLAGGHMVLRDVSCKIAAGSHVAVVGPSGAGKSSLLGLLLGFHRAAQGHVRVEGQTLEGAHLQRVRATSAWIDPQTQLFNRSLFDNVVYGASPDSLARAGTAIANAELEGVLRRLPDGLQTQLGENGSLVSGGEGQRVRLARGLIRKGTRLALMDEPFRGLDGGARKRMLARTRAELRHATLICATHDIVDTTDFDRVLVVENGTIVEDGAPAELLARSDSRYRALLDAEQALLTQSSAAVALTHIRLLDGRVVRDNP
jgi:ATP-binding cassette subfamily B protein